jgi:hypothetical protein
MPRYRYNFLGTRISCRETFFRSWRHFFISMSDLMVFVVSGGRAELSEQGCQIFLDAWYQNRKNVQIEHNMYRMVTKSPKTQLNIPNGHKMYQHYPIWGPENFSQIGIFGLKTNHLATLSPNTMDVYPQANQVDPTFFPSPIISFITAYWIGRFDSWAMLARIRRRSIQKSEGQGCQMLCFQTNLGKFCRALDWIMSTYFTAIWTILCSFSTFFRFWYHEPSKIWQSW